MSAPKDNAVARKWAIRHLATFGRTADICRDRVIEALSEYGHYPSVGLEAANLIEGVAGQLLTVEEIADALAWAQVPEKKFWQQAMGGDGMGPMLGRELCECASEARS